jgi:hypothetical protein
MIRKFMFMFFVQVNPVAYLLDRGAGVSGAMSKKFVSKAVFENGDGLDV